jgi:hypothetical protein
MPVHHFSGYTEAGDGGLEQQNGRDEADSPAATRKPHGDSESRASLWLESSGVGVKAFATRDAKCEMPAFRWR